MLTCQRLRHRTVIRERQFRGHLVIECFIIVIYHFLLENKLTLTKKMNFSEFFDKKKELPIV